MADPADIDRLSDADFAAMVRLMQSEADAIARANRQLAKG